ncbi:MAG: 3-hydroxybutyrate dehydrogenase, partial [Alphaproteobacteria bacterium CG_4_9_14_3_um_filter_47_13]
MTLKGKTALITGSTSGIGLGIAQGFAAEGINLVINGFGKPKDIEKERAGLEAAGVKVVYNAADMTKPDEIAAMIEDTVREFGSLDILVNNAGIQNVAPV